MSEIFKYDITFDFKITKEKMSLEAQKQYEDFITVKANTSAED
jgi:hypothetical protein